MSNKPLILIGAGGHATGLVEILLEQKREIIAVVAPSMTDSGCGILSSFPHYESDEKVFDYDVDEIELVNGIGAMPKSSLRETIHVRFTQAGYKFAKVIANSAFVSANAKLGHGVQVMRNATVCLGTTVDESVIINTNASIDHDCIIGKHCHIAPGVVLSGNVILEDGVHLATGANVINGVRIGKRAIVSVGVAITKSVKEDSIVYSTKTMTNEQV